MTEAKFGDVTLSSGNPQWDSSVTLASLRKELNEAEDMYRLTEMKQGFLGHFTDALRNGFGGSENSDWFISRFWSSFLDADVGSSAVKAKFAHAEKVLSDAHYVEDADELQTSDTHDGKHLKVFADVEAFDRAERRGVDTVSNLAACLVGMSTKRFPFLSGALTKESLKLLDGGYSKPLQDALVGGALGMSIPLATKFGVNRLGTSVIVGSTQATALGFEDLQKQS